MVDNKDKKDVPKLSALPKNFQDWEVGSNYDIVKQVGSGSYGYVVEAIQKSTGKKVAIKRFNNIFEDLVDCKRILREITLLRKLQHVNLISIIEIIEPANIETFDTIYLVMDYCQSDLKKLFKSPIHLQNVHIQTLVYNILLGIKYLHSAEVLHRDLKPANVLINEDCSVKICDFGLARSVEGIEGAHIYDKKDDDEEEDEDDRKKLPPPSKKGNLLSKEPPKDAAGSGKKGQPPLQRSGKLNAKNIKRELTGHVVTRW